jgi:SOS-response transcriptional repressor LexA
MTSFPTSRPAEYAVLELALPGRPVANLGVLLFDPATDRLEFRLRSDIEALADPEDAEVVSDLAGDFAVKIREVGGRRFLEHLEDSLSNALRISHRHPVEIRNFDWTLRRLYDQHVLGMVREPAKIIPFVTHLPLYSLRAAASRFGEDMEVEPEDWVDAPPDLRLSPDMYVVHVTGRSMEPKIPDGSLAVFRYQPGGSRQGKSVLVWRRGASESGGEFTIKVYQSRKQVTEDAWRHTEIRLKPVNPAFDTLEVEEGADYRVLGELVRLLPGEN